MSNILINNFNKIKLNLSKSEYYDLTLSKEKDMAYFPDGSSLYDDNLISFIDINNPECISGNTIYSLYPYTWSDAVNNGVVLNNIGFTGIDNGLIKFDINNITPSGFTNLVTGSSLTISSGDTRLVLDLVSGNTTQYIYPINIVSGLTGYYLDLQGGFYQGFFKLNSNYSILPVTPNNGLCFEFLVTPDFTTTPLNNTLNYQYPNNKGIFFYMGTRAENKFWNYYNNVDSNQFDVRTGSTNNIIFDNNIKTHSGYTLSGQNQTLITTDNKFLFYNQTATGQTVDKSGLTEYNILLTDKKNDSNYFLLFNQTMTGNTVDKNLPITADTINYNIKDDIIDNAIAFRIKDDGSIGYRTINYYCTSGNTYQYEVIEEYSTSGVTSNSTQTLISVRMAMSEYSTCNNSKRKYKLMFYVNGKLVFVSQELPELVFRKLDDVDDKQETIPFNISLGGGTQGLIEMIGIPNKYILPLEKYFAGTFIGQLNKFRMYNNTMDCSKIRNNYIFDLF